MDSSAIGVLFAPPRVAGAANVAALTAAVLRALAAAPLGPLAVAGELAGYDDATPDGGLVAAVMGCGALALAALAGAWVWRRSA